MLCSAAVPDQQATIEAMELHGAPSSRRSRDPRGPIVAESATASCQACSESCSSVHLQESHRAGDDNTAAERAAVEKIHLLPVSREAPKAWVFAALTGLMKEGKTVRQYLYLKVKRPIKESMASKNKTMAQEQRQKPQPQGRQQQHERQQQGQEHEHEQQQQYQRDEPSSTLETSDDEYTYIVVACLPHSGVVTSSTVVFTSGSPLQPLRRVQLLALIHPNSAYARRAGVASYSEALQRGVVGEFSTSNNSNSGSRRDQQNQGPQRLAFEAAGNSEGGSDNSSSGGGAENSAGAPVAAAEAEHRRLQLGSPFDWSVFDGTGERRRRRQRPPREYNRAEEVIAAVLDDSDVGSGSGEDESGDEHDMGGGVPFRLGDAAGPEECSADSLTRHQQQRRQEDEQQVLEPEQPLFRQQRTLQLNFNFSPSFDDQRIRGRGSERPKAGAQAKAESNLSEKVLFYDFVAPYFRARNGEASLPCSHATAADGGSCRDTAVVVFPGKKLVIKDMTFVVWATDPGNGPGFVWKDTVRLQTHVVLLLSYLLNLMRT